MLLWLENANLMACQGRSERRVTGREMAADQTFSEASDREQAARGPRQSRRNSQLMRSVMKW